MNKVENYIGGLKIRTINIIAMVASCILCSTILVSSFESERKYNSMFFDVSDYTDSTKAISDFKDATEYLTNQARLFVIHKDASFLKDYFDEINVTKRREQSLEVLKLTHEDDETIQNLHKAITESEDLKLRELYAMKLVCEVVPLTMDELPSEISSISLSSFDAALSDCEKLAKAQEMLFDASYINSKERILKYTSLAFGSLCGHFVDHLEKNDVLLIKSFLIHKIIEAFRDTIFIAVSGHIFVLHRKTAFLICKIHKPGKCRPNFSVDPVRITSSGIKFRIAGFIVRGKFPLLCSDLEGTEFISKLLGSIICHLLGIVSHFVLNYRCV